MSNWEWKKIGDVAEIKGRIGFRGYTKSDLVKKGEGAITLSPSNIKDNKLFFDNCSYISWAKYDESPEIQVSIGDIVFCKTASIGKVAIVESLPEKTTLNPQFIVLKKITCNNKYLYYYLFCPELKKKIQAITTGTAVPTLSQSNFSAIKLPIPPLAEQKRIVKTLDEKFAKIDKLKTAAETNLKNAKELFETTLEKELNPLSRHSERSEESRADLPSGWEWKTLGNVCEILSDLINPTEEKYLNMYHVGGANIESETGRIIDLKTSEEEGLTSGKFVFDDSVVLYNKIRPYLKKVARPNFAGICSADMYPLSPKNGMLKDFLYYILIASDFTDYAIKHSDRAGMPKLNRKALFVYEFPLPPLSVQKEIVARLDKLSENVKRLEANYKQIIADCDELKKTILKQTFQGGN